MKTLRELRLELETIANCYGIEVYPDHRLPANELVWHAPNGVWGYVIQGDAEDEVHVFRPFEEPVIRRLRH